ncbi:peroxidase-related enzyme [Pseudovibrio sp. SPO723]|uniref:peroxidase-related enzyme n=1 Tax=Nesiotobacter zosterae TaxID=392721 RepID=UPI0029C3AE67|nr:peroxidase-related enzyme [Pseudovibrio sp. SPO723]MDX5594374.1 peroxidase-related enzyme [Pseudovibrio sp. SPO723]
MPKKAPVELDLYLPIDLPEDIAILFSKCQAKLGLIPNVLVSYAHRPEKLRVFSQYYNELMLGHSGLTKEEREMIAVVVSSANDCWYCQVAHGAALRQYTGDPVLGEAITLNYRYADVTDRQRVMLDFAMKLTTKSAELTADDRDLLREHGFSEEDIWDICEVASFFNMSNRLASATGMRPNHEYHFQARERGADKAS